MSFQFSPETILAEINREIEKAERQINNKEDELPFLKEDAERLRKLARDLNSTSSRAVSNNANLKRDVAIRQIIELKDRVKNLLDRRRIFETEIEVRSLEPPIDIEENGETTVLEPEITIQREELPLKELAILATIFILL